MIAQARFEHGLMLMTRGVAQIVRTEPGATRVVSECVARHLSGDCGEMDEDDVLANMRAILSGERIFSAYDTAFGRLWIITESDRSATTVLLPEEY